MANSRFEIELVFFARSNKQLLYKLFIVLVFELLKKIRL